MSKRKIENYIPDVIKVLEKEFPDKVIDKTFNGYISAFGASVIQSGLKSTIALFENTNASTDADKSRLMKIILKVLNGDSTTTTLLNHVLKSDNEQLLKQNILDIAVAVKLSIRTFELKKGG